MSRLFLLFFIAAMFFSCKRKTNSKIINKAIFESKAATDFTIRFADGIPPNLFKDSVLYGSKATVALKNVKGYTALEVKTIAEFSDAFIDLEKLFGHTIYFSKARYIEMKLLVPKESWINALKFNFMDANGNFGGCNEIVNNFHGNHDRWMDVVVDMQEHIPGFKNWHGDVSPLPRTRFLSFNPYNANQADSSSIYIQSIKLSDEKPQGSFTKALAKRPLVEPNSPHTITFDDDELLYQQMAIRAFESTYQAMSKNIAGNTSMAIRLKGKTENTHLAFLPILDKMTGKPVDFTKVERLKFSYFLTSESADFDGACLYLADESWNSVLFDKTVFTDFKKGEWTDVTIDLSDLDLELVRGEGPVLPNVYEIRLGLNYRPGQKNIEMWLDDFGWE